MSVSLNPKLSPDTIRVAFLQCLMFSMSVRTQVQFSSETYIYDLSLKLMEEMVHILPKYL